MGAVVFETTPSRRLRSMPLPVGLRSHGDKGGIRIRKPQILSLGDIPVLYLAVVTARGIEPTLSTLKGLRPNR